MADTKKEEKRLHPPQWLGYPILDNAHVQDLETRAAINEFHSMMPRAEAERAAHEEYVREQRERAAAHHIAGMKAAMATGNHEDARKHWALYDLHLKALGKESIGSIPPEVEKRMSEDQGQAPLYRFKAHKGDLYALHQPSVDVAPPQGQPVAHHSPQNIHGQELPVNAGGWPAGTESWAVQKSEGRKTRVYRCKHCSTEQTVTTNHTGPIYDRCPGCSWKGVKTDKGYDGPGARQLDYVRDAGALHGVDGGGEKSAPKTGHLKVIKAEDLNKGDVIQFPFALHPTQHFGKKHQATVTEIPTDANSVWDDPGSPNHGKWVDPVRRARAIAGTLPKFDEPRQAARGIKGQNAYDYTHLLDPEASAKGYTLILHHTPGHHDGFMRAELFLNGQSKAKDIAYPSTPQPTDFQNVGHQWVWRALRNHQNWINYGVGRDVQKSEAKQCKWRLGERRCHRMVHGDYCHDHIDHWANKIKQRESQSEFEKADLPPAGTTHLQSPPPKLHSTMEGFMAGLKALPKGSPERGKFITAHMNHPPFQAALQAHPQGAAIRSMLNQHLNGANNAGFKPGATVTVVKSEQEETLESALEVILAVGKLLKKNVTRLPVPKAKKRIEDSQLLGLAMKQYPTLKEIPHDEDLSCEACGAPSEDVRIYHHPETSVSKCAQCWAHNVPTP